MIKTEREGKGRGGLRGKEEKKKVIEGKRRRRNERK